MLKVLAALIFFTQGLFSQSEETNFDLVPGSGEYSFTFPSGWQISKDVSYPSGFFAGSFDEEVLIRIYELYASMQDVIMTTGNYLHFNYVKIDDYAESVDVIAGTPP